MKDMTNAPETADPRPLPEKNSPSVPHQWQQLKAEGGTRLQRISKIFQAAFSETKTELKSGTESIRPIAQDLSSTVTENLKGTSRTAVNEVNKTWKDSPDTVTALQSLLLSFAQALKTKLMPWYSAEAKTIDAALMKSHGGRYDAIRRNLKKAKARYVQAAAPIKVPKVGDTKVDLAASETMPLNTLGDEKLKG